MLAKFEILQILVAVGAKRRTVTLYFTLWVGYGLISFNVFWKTLERDQQNMFFFSSWSHRQNFRSPPATLLDLPGANKPKSPQPEEPPAIRSYSNRPENCQTPRSYSNRPENCQNPMGRSSSVGKLSQQGSKSTHTYNLPSKILTIFEQNGRFCDHRKSSVLFKKSSKFWKGSMQSMLSSRGSQCSQLIVSSVDTRPALLHANLGGVVAMGWVFDMFNSPWQSISPTHTR